MERTSELPAGTALGPYTLQQRIGRGATATVYLAHDKAGRPFAVKVRRSGQSAMDRRFLREFESMRLLRVPGVVQVHEAGIEESLLWFSMDLVQGRSFYTWAHKEPDLGRRAEQVIALGFKLCETLAALHEAGFVHRDVKPSNVLVDAEGNVHVLDFGIGRYFNESDTLSRSGEVIGTIPFMAPEQLAGLPTGPEVDLFATGLMLHEAIAGRRPRPMSTVGWIPRICLERMPPLATLYPEIPLGLSKVVERLCAVDPTERPTARDAARMLGDVARGQHPPEWPEPVFVDPGEWWQRISDAVLEQGEGPSTWVLDGPSGSGKRRVAEQIQRNGLLQGTWTLRLHCRCDHVGGPLVQLLETLTRTLDEPALAKVIGPHASILRRLWPHLELPRSDSPLHSGAPSTTTLVQALAEIIERLGEHRAILLIVMDLEQVDGVTARALPAIHALAGPKVGLLILHESRWATARSRGAIDALVAQGAGHIEVPPLELEPAQQMAAALCPAAPPAVPAGATAQFAVEQGWAALARWRGEHFERPEAALWPVSLGLERVPLPVFRALVGRSFEERTQWLRADGEAIALHGDTARALARSRLAGLRKSASTLAHTWLHALGDRARTSDVARLHLIAGQDSSAWIPAARTAIEADRRGQYAESRRWLLLLDTLPAPATRPAGLDFDVALAKARVALRTDALQVHDDLLEAAEQRASTPEEAQRVRSVRAEYGLRAGTVRQALVTALKLGATGVSPRVTVRALLVAVHCRVSLQQLDDAERELTRAESILAEAPNAIFEVQASNWRSELAFQRRELGACREICQRTIQMAQDIGYTRGLAFAASRLGQVLRLLGHRREAEHQALIAREAFQSTGDVYLDAESGLALATLRVERGEALGARHALDATIRRIRALHLDHLLPTATRLALQVATLRGDPADAAVALAAIEELPDRDPETPAALVRWYRSRGDIETALEVPAPPAGTWGRCLWRIERARAAISADYRPLARTELAAARQVAAAKGFQELLLYARLLSGVVQPIDDASWDAILREASTSVFTEVYLGALEMDGRRRVDQGDIRGALRQFRALAARSAELGYRPGVEEAQGWVRDDDEETVEGRAPLA